MLECQCARAVYRTSENRTIRTSVNIRNVHDNRIKFTWVDSRSNLFEYLPEADGKHAKLTINGMRVFLSEEIQKLIAPYTEDPNWEKLQG